MSNTPLTDRQVQGDEDDDPPMVVHVEFARGLERDLAAARERIAELEAERDVAQTQLSAATHQLKELAQCRARVAELEAERDRLETALGALYYHLTDGKLSKPYDFTSVMEAEIEDAIQARMKPTLAALEAEVTKWSCAWCEANARVAELEAERDAALKAVDENWVTHQQVIEARKAADDVAERSIAVACDLDKARDQLIERGASLQFANERIAELQRRHAALEAERDRLLEAFDAATDILDDRGPEPISHKLKKFAALRAALAAAPQEETK